ncbi:MAG: hypothetical protein U0Q19_16320 [Kineosporiaceae bacterium]
MAQGFGADTTAAGGVASDLRSVSAELQSMAGTAVIDSTTTGSARVTDALRRFVESTSEHRETAIQLIDAAAGRLQGLVEGSAAVDGVLVATLS